MSADLSPIRSMARPPAFQVGEEGSKPSSGTKKQYLILNSLCSGNPGRAAAQAAHAMECLAPREIVPVVVLSAQGWQLEAILSEHGRHFLSFAEPDPPFNGELASLTLYTPLDDFQLQKLGLHWLLYLPLLR